MFAAAWKETHQPMNRVIMVGGVPACPPETVCHQHLPERPHQNIHGRVGHHTNWERPRSLAVENQLQKFWPCPAVPFQNVSRQLNNQATENN